MKRNSIGLADTDAFPVKEPTLTSRKKPNNIFNSHPKKSMNEVNEIEAILNILCINCQELINTENIEKHSANCTTLSETVISLESLTQTKEIEFKLVRLLKCIEDVNKNPDLKPGDKNYTLILIRLIGNIVKNPEKNEVEKARNSISSVSTSFRGSMSIRIYIDRFQSLIISLSKSLQDDLKEDSIKIQQIMEAKSKEIEELKSKTKEYEKRNKVLEHIISKTPRYRTASKAIEEIQSNLGTSRHSSSSVGSNIVKDDETQFLISSDSIEYSSTEDLRKYFYSICLSQKIMYAKQSQQKLSIKKLFKAVNDLNIPPEQWWKFINQQVLNPDPVFAEDPPRRIIPPKKKQAFETIIEEDN
jgi:hypothetical protein